MKTIMYNETTKECTATAAQKGSKRFTQLITNGYVIIGSVRGFNIVVTKYKK